MLKAEIDNTRNVPAILLGLAGPRRQRPPQRDVVAEVQSAIDLRRHCREVAAERRLLERQAAVWRRVAARVTIWGLIGGLTFVVVSHALAQ